MKYHKYIYIYIIYIYSIEIFHKISHDYLRLQELVDPLSSHADTAPEHRATRGALRGLALATAVGSLAVTLGKLMMTLRCR
jgi:hypothetical protein